MTEDQKAALLTDYKDNRSVREIGREFGISERQVYNILSTLPGFERRKKTRTETRLPMSKVHEAIGLRLYDFYHFRMERRDAANRLGWSSQSLRMAEQGFMDLTLFDLQDLATFMDISIGDLLNEHRPSTPVVLDKRLPLAQDR